MGGHANKIKRIKRMLKIIKIPLAKCIRKKHQYKKTYFFKQQHDATLTEDFNDSYHNHGACYIKGERKREVSQMLGDITEQNIVSDLLMEDMSGLYPDWDY